MDNKPPHRTSSPLLVALTALVLFWLGDALLFRSGLYIRVLEPDSNAGRFELTLKSEKERHPSKQTEFLFIGDSRLAEGFSEKEADHQLSGLPIKAINRAVPGSTPRVWYYQLREMDPTRGRYRAIVFGIGIFNDYDYGSGHVFADSVTDYRALLFHLGYRDIFRFALSFHDPSLGKEAALALLFKGHALKYDLQHFLAAPGARLAKRALFDEKWQEWQYAYEGLSGSLSGLTYDSDTRSLAFPEDIDAAKRRGAHEHLAALLAPASGATASFRRQWLGAIINRYQGSGTMLLFSALPRHPAFPLYPDQHGVGSGVREWAAANDQVLLLDDSALDPINLQDNFHDHLHVNQQGRTALTRTLCRQIEEILQRLPPQRPPSDVILRR